MPEYPPLSVPAPSPYTDDHIREWEQQLQNLAVADAIIKKCERCKIPVDASRRDCDGLCEFFQRMIAEERGQQAARPAPI